MTAIATAPMSDRRAAATAAMLVGAVVLVIGFGSGIGAVLSRGSGAGATPAGHNLGGAVQDAGDVTTTIGHANASTGSSGATKRTTATGSHGATSPSSGSSMDSGAMSSTAGSTPTTTVSSQSSGTKSALAACSGTDAVSAMLNPFVVHFDKAHLETSPGDQANQALDIDQYVKTHTVLLEQMLAPVVNVALELSDALGPFMVHLDKAHLETSPGEQVAQLLDADQYVKTHTVLVEDMLAPAMGALTTGCSAGP